MEVVSFQISKKLKEKGFNAECYGHYFNGEFHTDMPPKHYQRDKYVSAPFISQVLKWLREEKEVDLFINPIFVYDENKHRKYGVEVFAPRLNKPIHCGYFNKWEQASLAGISWTLDNLI